MSEDQASIRAVPVAPSPAALPLGRLVARFVDRAQRCATDAALASGHVQEIAREDVLAEDQMPELVRNSLWLLAAGGVAFGALEAASLAAHRGRGMPRQTLRGRIGRLVAGNLLGYVLMLPLHEAAHAGATLALGGRPRFGARFPLALYCAAPDQIFTREGYTCVLLAPLVALSAVGAALTWRSPTLGAYLLFALAGNVSGAVGDLVSARAVRRLPPDALIADTATGYTAYLVDAQ
jgi:hypothetical protein